MIGRAFLLLAPALFPLFLSLSLMQVGGIRDGTAAPRVVEPAGPQSIAVRIAAPEFLAQDAFGELEGEVNESRVEGKPDEADRRARPGARIRRASGPGAKEGKRSCADHRAAVSRLTVEDPHAQVERS
jgi:hypothetical protein